MVSLYPTAGAPTASLDMFDGIMRLVTYGGGVSGGSGGWVIGHFIIDWDGPVGGCGVGGSVGGGYAIVPARFGLPLSGAVVGGKAVYPPRWIASGGGHAGGVAKYPHRVVADGGAIAGRSPEFTGQTDWRFWSGMAIPTHNTGGVAGGSAGIGVCQWEYVGITRVAVTASPIIRQDVTLRLSRTTV